MTQDVLTMADCRSCGFCVSGIIERCKALGLDHRQLIKHGIPLDVLRDIDDAQVKRAIAFAEARIAAGDQHG